MKLTVLAIVLSLSVSNLLGQSREEVEYKLDSLKNQKSVLQDQIKEIDKEITEYQKTHHNLTFQMLENGHPGYSVVTIDLFDEAGNFGLRKKLATIPKNTLLLIEYQDDKSYKTTFSGTEGFVSINYIGFNNPESKELLRDDWSKIKRERRAELERQQQLESEQRSKESAEKAATVRNARNKKIREKYSSSDAERIIQRKIWIGMTKGMLIDSWGYPDDINRSTGSWGVHEQCIYGDTYVYVENGKVTSWQD